MAPSHQAFYLIADCYTTGWNASVLARSLIYRLRSCYL